MAHPSPSAQLAEVRAAIAAWQAQYFDALNGDSHPKQIEQLQKRGAELREDESRCLAAALIMRPEPDLIMRLDIEVLKAQLIRQMHTSQTESQIGQVYFAASRSVEPSNLTFLSYTPASSPLFQTAETEVLATFSERAISGALFQRKRKEMGSSSSSSSSSSSASAESPGCFASMSLADAMGTISGPFSEEKHMQPVSIQLLSTAAAAVQSSMSVADTHNSNRLGPPRIYPDASLMSAPGSAYLSGMVTPFEFKPEDSISARMIAWGQLIGYFQRIAEEQRGRRLYVGAILTMNSFEVMAAQRQDNGTFEIQRVGPEPFSISAESPGFRLLVCLLAAPQSLLGYSAPVLPPLTQMPALHGPAYRLQTLSLIRHGTAAGGGSFVYKVEARIGTEVIDAVLKLCSDDREANVLAALRAVNAQAVIAPLAQAVCQFSGAMRTAILMPFVTLLESDDSLYLFATVAHDIAQAIEECAKAGIAHRDISPFNFGHIDGRGKLFDFSAAKMWPPGVQWQEPPVSPTGLIQNITGTRLYAPPQVLLGGPHSVVTQLEGLFISLMGISCAQRLHGRHLVMTTIEEFGWARIGALTRPVLPEENDIANHLRNFVHDLHDLFFPLPNFGAKDRVHKTDVTAADFRAICSKHMQNQ